jgi:pimeloyl-ACP methyl ester carboxylesterase
MSLSVAWSRFSLLSLLVACIWAYEQCSKDQGGGICPTGNTCCRRRKGDVDSSGCIPNDLGLWNATCCDDGHTGCAVGYRCGPHGLCLARDEEITTDPLVQVLPRYRLCHSNALATVHGFPVVADAKLAYYSSHGDITDIHDNKKIRMALVSIHGSARNADDYFCTATAATEQQTIYQIDAVLVIAPRFPVETDTDLDLEEGGIAIRWKDDGAGGPWRYGANANAPEEMNDLAFSSYDALDRIMVLLLNKNRFPNLERISVAGHSAGGQFVQRWSLMTAQWDERLRGVVANPSSYAFLTPLRSSDQEWQLPSLADCPGYNQWEWGLDAGGNYSVPYIDSVMEYMDATSLAQRFATRQVFYLAGSQDVCNVPHDDAGWCRSHGLEITCMDLMQGSNRWERNLHYVSSLRLVGVPHQRLVILGVGHDHSLMFNSENGLYAMFGNVPSSPAREIDRI